MSGSDIDRSGSSIEHRRRGCQSRDNHRFLWKGSTVIETATSSLQFFDRPDDDFADHFRREGFALLRDALTPEQVRAVNDDALKLCRGDLGKISFRGPDASTILAREEAIAAVRDDEAVLRQYLC